MRKWNGQQTSTNAFRYKGVVFYEEHGIKNSMLIGCFGTKKITTGYMLKLNKPKPDFLVLEAIQKIQFHRGDIRIKKLIADLHISRDSFEKRFRRLAGTSSKQFSSIVRLRSVIENHSQGETLTDTALTAGYLDQAHFIKDFKTFTGPTPQNFFKSSAYW